jgi:transcriptional regulator with XRE-family HTH domain
MTLQPIMLKDDHKRLANFRKNLKRLRVEKGHSLRSLAAESGIEHSLLSKYESGERQPLLATVYKLIDALQVAPEDLLGK